MRLVVVMGVIGTPALGEPSSHRRHRRQRRQRRRVCGLSGRWAINAGDEMRRVSALRKSTLSVKTKHMFMRLG